MPVKAAVLRAFEEPLQICEFPDPAEPGPGEAVVAVEMAGICGTDIHLWLGQLPIMLPVILGHEAVGRVVALGAGLERDWRGARLRPGDRVTWASSIVCGECYYCRRKRQPTRCLSRKAYGISYPSTEAPHLRGGYAQKIHLRTGTAIFGLPEALPAEAVVGAGCGLVTAIHGLERGPVEWGDTVVIQGSGPVGLGALAIAKQSGASRIVVVGGPAHRLELAREFGADATIDIDEFRDPAERERAVVNAAGDFGADVVIECVGHPEAVNEGMNFCRDGARFLVLGKHLIQSPHHNSQAVAVDWFLGLRATSCRHGPATARKIPVERAVRLRDHAQVPATRGKPRAGNGPALALREDGLAAVGSGNKTICS